MVCYVTSHLVSFIITFVRKRAGLCDQVCVCVCVCACACVCDPFCKNVPKVIETTIEIIKKMILQNLYFINM